MSLEEMHPHFLRALPMDEGIPQSHLLKGLVAGCYFPGEDAQGAELEISLALLRHPWKTNWARQAAHIFLSELGGWPQAQLARLIPLVEPHLLGQSSLPSAGWLEPGESVVENGLTATWTRREGEHVYVCASSPGRRACTRCHAPLPGARCGLCGSGPTRSFLSWFRKG